jgi:hypothetical protein
MLRVSKVYYCSISIQPYLKFRFFENVFYFHTMKIFPTLKWITLGNLILCFATFYFMDKASVSPYNHTLGLSTVFGCIFWIGIFVYIAPLILGDDNKKIIWQKEYASGTLFTMLVNLIGIIAISFYVGSLFSYDLL